MGKKRENEPLRVIVNRRIDALLVQAKEAIRDREEDSIRYVKMAKKLAMRHRISMGKKRKMKYCKKCLRPFIEGYNVKIRINEKEGRIEYLCSCGEKNSYFYKKKKKDRIINKKQQ